MNKLIISRSAPFLIISLLLSTPVCFNSFTMENANLDNTVEVLESESVNTINEQMICEHFDQLHSDAKIVLDNKTADNILKFKNIFVELMNYKLEVKQVIFEQFLHHSKYIKTLNLDSQETILNWITAFSMNMSQILMGEISDIISQNGELVNEEIEMLGKILVELITLYLNEDKNLIMEFIEFIKTGKSLEDFKAIYLNKVTMSIEEQFDYYCERSNILELIELYKKNKAEIIERNLHNRKGLLLPLANLNMITNFIEIGFVKISIDLLNQPTLNIKIVNLLLEQIKLAKLRLERPLEGPIAPEIADKIKNISNFEKIVFASKYIKIIFKAIEAKNVDVVELYSSKLANLLNTFSKDELVEINFYNENGQNFLGCAIKLQEELSDEVVLDDMASEADVAKIVRILEILCANFKDQLAEENKHEFTPVHEASVDNHDNLARLLKIAFKLSPYIPKDSKINLDSVRDW